VTSSSIPTGTRPDRLAEERAGSRLERRFAGWTLRTWLSDGRRPIPNARALKLGSDSDGITTIAGEPPARTRHSSRLRRSLGVARSPRRMPDLPLHFPRAIHSPLRPLPRRCERVAIPSGFGTGLSLRRMRTFSFTRHAARQIGAFRRRNQWIFAGASVRQVANTWRAATECVLGRERLESLPTVLKVDISPLCNLRCTVCVHARAGEGQEALRQQRFHAGQRMSLSDYRRLIDEVSSRSAAVSLYYLGDPLTHPDLEGFCECSRARGMRSHISSNFSFNLSDDRLRALINCGLTHLTVCVDGMDQVTYGKTRVGGDLGLVLANLDRFLALRAAMRKQYPRVEVQFIKFQHNIHQIESARAWCKARGVDQFSTFWGSLHNMTDACSDHERHFEPKARRIVPLCWWPYFSIVIRFDGEAIPCCNHRQGDQYRVQGRASTIGNVLNEGILSVWNSPQYRRMRKLVTNPRLWAREQDDGSFCAGCRVIFHSGSGHLRRAGGNRWEDLYEMDERNRVRRRSAPLVQITASKR
jgi:MoaA/NifB/PqqE/SkfB family radical SAM enzyme